MDADAATVIVVIRITIRLSAFIIDGACASATSIVTAGISILGVPTDAVANIVAYPIPNPSAGISAGITAIDANIVTAPALVIVTGVETATAIVISTVTDVVVVTAPFAPAIVTSIVSPVTVTSIGVILAAIVTKASVAAIADAAPPIHLHATVATNISIAPASVISTAISVPGIIGITAIGITHIRLPATVGWLLVTPVPLPASDGSSPVAVACGLVVPWPTSDGGSGGVDVIAEAATTFMVDTVANIIQNASTTSPRVPSPPNDAGGAPLVHAGPNPALLLMTIRMMTSLTFSICGRGLPSEGPRKTRQFVDHSLPPPTVVAVRAAKRGGGRPAAFADTSSATTLPRPGPASLLSASMWQQRSHITQQRGRAGNAPRATGRKVRKSTGTGKGI